MLLEISSLALFASQNAQPAILATGSGPDIPWVRILIALFLCILMAFFAVGLLRLRHGLPFLPGRLVLPKRLKNSDARRIAALEIVERLSVGPASQFVILKRGSQNYLLHLTQQGATEIDRFSDEEGRLDEMTLES